MEGVSTGLDYGYGGVQTVVSVVGCILNLLSLFYFTTLKTKNKNSEFFKRLYMIITLVDLLICIAVIPVIESVFSEDRMGILLSNIESCNIWAVFWNILPQMSIFLVGMLSISRYLVLKYPTRLLNLSLAWIVPTACLFTLIVVNVGMLVSKKMFAIYFQEYLTCSYSIFPLSNVTRLVSRKELRQGVVHLAVFNVIPGS